MNAEKIVVTVLGPFLITIDAALHKSKSPTFHLEKGKGAFCFDMIDCSFNVPG